MVSVQLLFHLLWIINIPLQSRAWFTYSGGKGDIHFNRIWKPQMNMQLKPQEIWWQDFCFVLFCLIYTICITFQDWLSAQAKWAVVYSWKIQREENSCCPTTYISYARAVEKLDWLMPWVVHLQQRCHHSLSYCSSTPGKGKTCLHCSPKFFLSFSLSSFFFLSHFFFLCQKQPGLFPPSLE